MTIEDNSIVSAHITESTALLDDPFADPSSREASSEVDIDKSITSGKFKLLTAYGCCVSEEDCNKAAKDFDHVKKAIEKVYGSGIHQKKDIQLELKPAFYDIVGRVTGKYMDGIPYLKCLTHNGELRKKHSSGGVFPFFCKGSGKNVKMLAVIELYFGLIHKDSEVSIVNSVPSNEFMQPVYTTQPSSSGNNSKLESSSATTFSAAKPCAEITTTVANPMTGIYDHPAF
ncbi:hypothetical protein MP638_004005 [Amoeboaphelidium occidentale]|nr:hypothetical protein MP638_004005 [Amoeboaphelidium occidentale]